MDKVITTITYNKEFKNLPIDTASTASKYPFKDMKVNEAFDVIVDPPKNRNKILLNINSAGNAYLRNTDQRQLKFISRYLTKDSFRVNLVSRDDPRFARGSHRRKYNWQDLKKGDTFCLEYSTPREAKYYEGIVQNAGRIFYKLNNINDVKVAIRRHKNNKLNVHILGKEDYLPFTEASYDWKNMKIDDYFIVENEQKANIMRRSGNNYFKYHDIKDSKIISKKFKDQYKIIKVKREPTE